MRISIPGLGNRLRRARNETGLSQEAVAERIDVSWLTIHRWEKSQRGVPDHFLNDLCDLYDKPLRWFLTLEEGDLENEQQLIPNIAESNSHSNRTENRVYRKIANAPNHQKTLIEKIVDDILSGIKQID